jgi:hypothetical protein
LHVAAGRGILARERHAAGEVAASAVVPPHQREHERERGEVERERGIFELNRIRHER